MNEDNCFLFALKAVEPVFRKEEYYFQFKNLETSMQIKLTNDILKPHRRKLYYNNEDYGPVWTYLKNRRFTGILIFWEHGGDIHAEGIKDGKVVEKPQPHVYSMMFRNCEIREFKLVTLDEHGNIICGLVDEYVRIDCRRNG